MTDICFEKAIQTLYSIQTAESLRLEEQTKVIEISFSEKFEKQMKKLIHRREKPYYVLINTAAKRVAMIILVAVITFVSTTIGIAKIYQPFADFIMEIFEDHTLFKQKPYDSALSADPLAEWKEYKLPITPDGFIVETYVSQPFYSEKKYVNSDGEYVVIIQSLLANSQSGFDTEGTEGEFIKVGNIDAFTFENKGETRIYIPYKSNSISIYGNIDKNELINIAISLNLEEK